MFENKTIGVVVPAYNEEKLIGRTLDTMPPCVDRIVVVDDCSNDRTAALVEERTQAQPDRIVLLRHCENAGVGGSIATGYKWCRDHAVDVAVVMAGDAQMDPADLPGLLLPVVRDEADYAKGNRFFSGEAWEMIPRWRYLGNAGLSLLTKIASGYWQVADSQSGYTAANLKVLKTLNWDQMYKRYGQPNDLLVRLNIYNFRVKDVPIRPIYNRHGKSGINIWITPKLAMLLFRLFLWRMFQKYIVRDFHPLIFFYAAAGLLLGVFSPVLTVRLCAYWLMFGNIPPINALAVMLCTITGLQFLLFAMWFDMEYNKSYR